MLEYFEDFEQTEGSGHFFTPLAIAASIGKFLYLFHVLPTKMCSTFVKFMHKGLVFLRLFCMVLTLHVIPEYIGGSMFHPCHKSTQKLFRIAVKISQILLQSDQTNVCEILTTRSVEMDTILAISPISTFGSFKTISWILLTISGVVISFGPPELGMVLCSYDRNEIRQTTSESFHTTEQSSNNIYLAWSWFLKSFFRAKSSV